MPKIYFATLQESTYTVENCFDKIIISYYYVTTMHFHNFFCEIRKCIYKESLVQELNLVSCLHRGNFSYKVAKYTYLIIFLKKLWYIFYSLAALQRLPKNSFVLLENPLSRDS